MVNDISALKQVPKIFFKGNAMPIQLIFFVTTRCNAKCAHCFYWSELNNLSKKELSLEEVEKMSRTMGELLILYLGGGEPFLRRDLPEIAETFYKNNNTRLVGIPTNAFLPEIMLPSIDRMCTLCPNANILINVSIDDIGKAHEDFRVVPGGWEKLMRTINGIKELKKKHKNLAFGCNATFNALNQDKIKDIYTYLRDEIKPDSININLVRGKPKDPHCSDIDIDKYNEVIAMLQRDLRNADMGYTTSSFQNIINQNQIRTKDIISETYVDKKALVSCTASRLIGVLYPDGELFPCELLDSKFRIGNIREVDYDFKKLWFSERNKEIAKWIVDTKCFCTHECFMSTNTMFTPKEIVGSVITAMTQPAKSL